MINSLATSSLATNCLYGGLAGGLFWAMIQIFTLVSAPSPPNARTTFAVITGSVFAVISGLWGARYLGPLICEHFHIQALDMITLTGFSVGAVFWAGAQAAIKVVVAFVPAVTQAALERITGIKGAKA